MTTKGESVADSALALPPDERAELAERLILSLDETYHADLTAAWDAEISRRVADVKDGNITLIAADQALEMIRQRKKP